MRRVGLLLVAATAIGCGESGPGGQDMDLPDGGGDLAPGAYALKGGEVAEVPLAAGGASVRLATPGGTERFVLVLASLALDASGETSVYSVTPGAGAGTASPSPVNGCSLSDADWKNKMLPAETPPAGTPPTVGDMRMIHVPVPNGANTIAAQVVAVGQRAVVWADVTPQHPANLDPGFVADFLKDFDELILPRERQVFGMESDLDKDGRVSLVFSPLTNLTAVAFFTGCDLGTFAGCPSTNKGEFLYLTPPANIAPPYNTPAAIKEILAHECGHLVNFNRKVLRNQLKSWDDSAYMIEGFGALAQDTMGFQAGNLYVTLAGLDQIDEFSMGDTLVDGTQYDLSRDGTLRGGSYLFTRWLYDRAGGDAAAMDGTVASKGGPAFIRALFDDPATVATALPVLGKGKIEEMTMDFYTTLALSNQEEVGGVAAQNGCFRFLPTVSDPVTMRPRGTNVYAKFHGMMMNGPALQTIDLVDKSLLAGGVEYIELDAAMGTAELAVTIQAEPKAMPRVRIARIQ